MVHTFFAVIRCQYYLLQKHIPVRTYLFRLTKIIVALLLDINKLAFRKASLILLNPTRIDFSHSAHLPNQKKKVFKNKP